MDKHPRLFIALLVSFLVHLTVLIWIRPQTQFHPSDVVLRVSLEKRPEARKIPVSQPVIPKPAITQPVTQPATTSPPPVKEEDRPSVSHFHWQPQPAYQQIQTMNAMQQARLARQREAHAAVVLAGLADIAVQLRPLVTDRIACTQQADHTIDCTPEPPDNLHPLLMQFLSLAVEAYRLGVAGNPVRMDFSPELGVSVALRSH